MKGGAIATADGSALLASQPTEVNKQATSIRKTSCFGACQNKKFSIIPFVFPTLLYIGVLFIDWSVPPSSQSSRRAWVRSPSDSYWASVPRAKLSLSPLDALQCLFEHSESLESVATKRTKETQR